MAQNILGRFLYLIASGRGSLDRYQWSSQALWLQATKYNLIDLCATVHIPFFNRVLSKHTKKDRDKEVKGSCWGDEVTERRMKCVLEHHKLSGRKKAGTEQ